MATRLPSSAAAPARAGEVLAFAASDEALLEGLRQGQGSAVLALFERYGRHVERILGRIVGADPELPDLVHDVFAGMLAGAKQVRKASALKDWLTSVAVFRARTFIRLRARRRLWERLFPSDELPDHAAPVSDDAAVEAVRVTYRLLDSLAADERIVFSLRILDGMKLTEVAEACSVSLATAKRRLARAQANFERMATNEPALADWMAGEGGNDD
jgi:RNA polymerase sigma-70 factor (ECF subfamily)